MIDGLTRADAALNRVWRDDEDGRAILLHVTDAGLAAISVEPDRCDSSPAGTAEGALLPRVLMFFCGMRTRRAQY
ncbi:MAG: hypothetical protein ACLFRZ_13045 [Rhodosalinus sp.]